MPDRLLKEGLKTSRLIGRVSEQAELIFVRLLVTVCPLGRYHAEPDLVKSATLPNRPRIRTSDVAAALQELESSGLISRWTVPEGAAYLVVHKFGQRLKYSVRSPFPAPPTGPADAPGQEVMGLAEPEPPPPPKKEVKRREVCVSAPARETHTPRLSDEEWQAQLRLRYPGIDLADEMAKALRYVQGQRGPQAKLTREFLERHWLEKAATGTAVSFATAKPKQENFDEEPQHWKAIVKDNYPDEEWLTLRQWHLLPEFWKKKLTHAAKEHDR